VSMLAPVILVAVLVIRRIGADDGTGDRPALVPGFVVGFVVLLTLNSFGLFPKALTDFSAELSRWALLTAIAAVGLKTSLREVMNVGLPAISLLVLETLFIGAFTVAALLWLGV